MTTPLRSSVGRVAYLLTDAGIPAFGRKGASAHVRAVVGELVSRGAELHLFTARPGGAPPPRLSSVTVHLLPRPEGSPAERERSAVHADRALTAALDEVGGTAGFDLVYQRYALWSAAGLELAAARGWRSVLEINAPLVEEQARHRTLVDRTSALAITRRAVRAATSPYAVSAAVGAWASELGGRPVPVLPNGVDTDRVRPRTAPPLEGELVIGFVGTFKPWHGVEQLVEAAAAVHHDPGMPAVRLLLVGDGPQLDTVLGLAASAGLAGRVESTGAVDPDDVPALLRRMDIAVAPYPAGEHYFSPLKVAEYLAAGLPTVVSGIGELPSLLRHGHDALVVPPGDTLAFTAAVRRLAADRSLRQRLGAAARDAATSRFGWSGVVDRVLALTGAAERAESEVA